MFECREKDILFEKGILTRALLSFLVCQKALCLKDRFILLSKINQILNTKGCEI